MFAWAQILEPEFSSALSRLPQQPAAHRVPPGTCGQPVRTPLCAQDMGEGPPSSFSMGMATRAEHFRAASWSMWREKLPVQKELIWALAET